MFLERFLILRSNTLSKQTQMHVFLVSPSSANLLIISTALKQKIPFGKNREYSKLAVC